MWNKIQGWKEHYLSQAGKETLIKTVIQAIPSYIMSIFMLPKTFCNKIASLIARFWWRSAGKERGIHWTKWAKLQKPKMEGGLGFRDLHAMNLALISKQVWRLQNNPNALWVRVLKSLYFPNSNIWEASRGRYAFWGWVSILKGRDFLNKHKAWHVKNGRNIKISGDKWMHSGDRLWLNDGNVNQTTVNDLIAASGDNWDMAKITQLIPNESIRKVLATPINTHLAEDTTFWPYSKDGVYNVKSGYKIAHYEVGEGGSIDNPSSPSEKQLWKSIWNAKVMLKIKNFIWRLVSDALPTKANLAKRGLGESSCCPICYCERETAEHIFLGCSWVKPVWFGSTLQWSIGSTDNVDIKWWVSEKIELILKVRDSESEHFLALFFNLLWGIWLGKNKYVFENTNVNPLRTINAANNLNQEFLAPNSRIAHSPP